MVEITAIGEGDSTTVARSTARDRVSTIRDSLTTVSDNQIRTVDLQIEDSSEMFDPDTDAQYRAIERLHIDCVPETAESIVVEVTDAGGTVQTVQFKLHADVHQQLQNKALTAAMERAREKAECIAAAEGVAVGKVQQVTTSEESSGMESIVDEALASSDVDLHPTPITVSERVEVVYELTEN